MSRLLLLFLLMIPAAQAEPPKPWTELQPGLELGVFTSPQISSAGDSKIRVLRVDPTKFELVLASASMGDGTTKTAKGWATDKGLLAAINASMYQGDHKTSVSFMRSGKHVNNRHLSKDKDLLAFGPKDAADPPVRIIDRGCEEHEPLMKRYDTVVQSIRMLSCDGRNVWSQQARQWSHAVIGIDGAGRPLLIHARSPWSTHDFVEILRKLPLDLKRLQYAEGGPEAQLYVNAGGTELEAVGSFETGFVESDDNAAAWAVPNVIGVRAK